MMKKLNIAFAGWGTGWHVTPISSLIEYAYTQPDILDQIEWLFWFGSRWQLEHKFADQLPSVQFVPIKSGKLRRYWTVRSTLENLRDVGYFNAWYLQSLYLLQKHKIDAVFCKWGYVALPVSLAAATLRIPVIVHESDTHPWLVNNIVSKVSKHNFDGFPNVLKNSTHIWQILSPKLLQKNNDLDTFTLDSNKKTLLIICGSQGSEVVFKQIIKELDTWWQIVKNLNIVVVLWLLNTQYKKLFAPYINVTSFDFLTSQELAELYHIADVAISRGSATTLAELEFFQIPKAIVPLPSHDQPINAARYRDNAGDIVVDQSNISELMSATQHHLDHPRKNIREKDEEFYAAHQKIREALLKSR